ncbi:MAG: T9SS type A sorting domain-containing protein, partial [Bacteroidetes bacterium]|nr:T9SS type A sorting domain-containing protein [Bacteroidota bacterium]
TISVTDTGTGTYFVEVINGCDTVYDTVVISVFPVVVVNLGSDTIICNGDSIILDAGNPGMIYNWSTIDSAQTITVNTTGTYVVEVINPAAGCSGSDTITITGSDGPAAGFTITSLGFTVTFTDTSVDAISWNWDFGDGTGTSTLQDPVYTYATDGSFLVTLIVTNPCGSDTITQGINVISGIRSITMPGDGIIIHPNPFSNTAILFFPQPAAEGYTFTLYNILGKEVKRIADIKTNELKITRDGLLRGFYFYKVENDEGILKTGKIIID